MKKNITLRMLLLLICTFTFALRTYCAAEPIATITVEAGEHTRIDTPVSVSLAEIPGVHKTFHFEEVKGSKRWPVPFQFDPNDSRRLCWILSGTLEPGQKRFYEILKAPTAMDKYPIVKAEENEQYIEITKGNSKILRYHHAVMPPPPGKSEKYARSAFIHPLWSPAGTVLTTIHPEDHIHHMGIWMPWTATVFEGRKVDFWNLDKGEGTVRFVKFLSETTGPVFGGFRSQHEHIAFNPYKGDKVALKEVWDIRVYCVGGPEKGYWLWDFVSTQRCGTDSPLHQLEYRYGGLGFRATLDWNKDNSDYLTSEGKSREDGHATRARWCDMFGETTNGLAGVTIMSHPKNFRHPEPMRIWPEGPIFFGYAPSQLGDWEMKPGKDYVFRYRFYVHEGKTDVAEIERFWYDFAEPPVVKLEIPTKAGKDDGTRHK